jgi:hypothetical protein
MSPQELYTPATITRRPFPRVDRRPWPPGRVSEASAVFRASVPILLIVTQSDSHQVIRSAHLTISRKPFDTGV